RRFQVVADVRVDVLVVVAVRQASPLPAKAFTAGVFPAGGAPAVAAPVPERFNQRAQQSLVRQHATTFTHGDVVRRIEADGGEIAESPDFLSAIGGAECVAAVFDQPQAMLLCE